MSKLILKCLTLWIFTLIGFCKADPSFSPVLQKLANDILGVDKFQKYLNKQFNEAATEDIAPAELVKSIAESIDLSLTKHIEALNRLNEAVIKDLQNPSSEPTPSMCCNFNNVTEDMRFRNEPVNPADYCQLSPVWQPDQQFSANTLSVMQENLKKEPTLKWQYFGSRNGSAFLYPAVDRCLDNYDPRLKHWYYMSAGGTPKDILILIDTSATMGFTYGSTGVSKLKVAIDAATNMVSTLTPNDRVGVISFDESPQFPNAQSCYSNYLALANARNKEILSDYLDQLSTANRNARYSPAIKEAFRLFNATQSSQGRVRVVLLLTDGRSTADRKESLCAISHGNALLNNSVVFMTFGVDPSMTADGQNLLTDIAQQTDSSCRVYQSNLNPIRAGVFKQVTQHDRNLVRSQIGFYYDMFGSVSSKVSFSVPYNDLLGLGLVTSACQAVIIEEKLQGVTCVDISIENIFKDIVNFKLGQLSYAYLMDNSGRTLLHPAVQTPENYETEPLFIDISSVEINDQSDNVRSSMISGGNGSLSGNANLVAHRGSSQIQGVDGFNKNANYYWYPISVMGASICLVIVEEERKLEKNWTGQYPRVNLAEFADIYDRSNDLLCGQWGKASTLAESMIRLAPKAFVEPFNYSLVGDDDNPSILLLRDFCEGKTNDSGDLTLQDGVTESIAMTYYLEDLWMKTSVPDYWDYTLVRYIGTEDGVFRIYPGYPMSKGYDPTKRPWYTAAVGAGQLREITISVPYNDTSGVVLLALCQAVFETRTSNGPTDSDPVFGVMAMDITLSSFYQFLITEFEPCRLENNQRCFIVDSSGFIVIHRDYVTSAPASVEHITGKEPSIAYSLMDKSIMKRDTCTDFIDITKQLFWKIDIDQIKQLDTCTIYPVEGSNIFIIAPNVDTSSNSANSCQCNNKMSNGHCDTQISCQCPCHSDISFDYCSWILPVSNTKPCLPPIAPINASDSKEVLTEGKTLPKCVICKIPGLFPSKSECVKEDGCCWNSYEAKCEGCSDETKPKINIIIPVVIAGTVAILLLIVLLICFICYQRKHTSRSWIPRMLSWRKDTSDEKHKLKIEDQIVNSAPDETGQENDAYDPSYETIVSSLLSSLGSFRMPRDSGSNTSIRVTITTNSTSTPHDYETCESRHYCPVRYNRSRTSGSDCSRCSTCGGVSNTRYSENQRGLGVDNERLITDDVISHVSSEVFADSPSCFKPGELRSSNASIPGVRISSGAARAVEETTLLKPFSNSNDRNTIPKTCIEVTIEQSGQYCLLERTQESSPPYERSTYERAPQESSPYKRSPQESSPYERSSQESSTYARAVVMPSIERTREADNDSHMNSERNSLSGQSNLALTSEDEVECHQSTVGLSVSDYNRELSRNSEICGTHNEDECQSLSDMDAVNLNESGANGLSQCSESECNVDDELSTTFSNANGEENAENNRNDGTPLDIDRPILND